nr:MAG TPA: hypothetical protein [Caudoviricetes sp.]DAU74959.1 MAG TPA: hypothetical protein [Caudoviricetes sp.]DAZ53420.1 MAG TPA: hypothetical protein [Caudoviricetes sp.]
MPSPGSPCSKVIFPIAIYGYQSQRTGDDSTSLYSVKSPSCTRPNPPFPHCITLRVLQFYYTSALAS